MFGLLSAIFVRTLKILLKYTDVSIQFFFVVVFIRSKDVLHIMLR